jgi:hypothetical protein
VTPLSHSPGPVITIEGIVIDVMVHREPKAAPEDGVPDFIEHGAMIDTGASDTCIDYRIAHALKLRQIDQRTIGTVAGRSKWQCFSACLKSRNWGSNVWSASLRQRSNASITAS